MIKELLKKYQFRPNDLLGQNFLLNEITLQDIVDSAEIKPDEQVLEIGPGIGNLTQLLAKQADFVLAVEKDQRYFPILKDVLGDHLQSFSKTPKSISNVNVVFADVMKFNFQELLKPGYKVVANIPYYITGKIIEMLIAAKNKPSRIVILVQKEVAQRIIAKPGNLSILALSVQMYADAKIVGIVPKEDFYPTPKVDSAILVLDLLPAPRFDINEKVFFRIVKAAFLGKRKQIHNTLKNNLKLDVEILSKSLEGAAVKPDARPQELTLDQWYALYERLKGHV